MTRVEEIQVSGRTWTVTLGTGRRPFVARSGETQIYAPTLNELRKYLARIGMGRAPWA